MKYLSYPLYLLLVLTFFSNSAAIAQEELQLFSPQQSSTAHGGSAARAIDGNTNGLWRGSSVTHTRDESEPWWSARLPSNSDISSIQLWNRTDSCCTSRLSNFFVFVSEQPLNSNASVAQLANDSNVDVYQVTGGLAESNITIPTNSTGQYIRVQLNKKDPLSLAEIKVFGKATNGPTVPNPPPSNGGDLFTSADWGKGYKGVFELPAQFFIGEKKFSFKSRNGGTGLDLTPNGNLLVMAEQDRSGGSAPVLAEVSIPTPGSDSLNPPVASLLKKVDLTGMLETDPDGNSASPKFEGNSSGTGIRVEDLLVDGNRIIASAIIGYDTFPYASHSHFVVNSLNLDSVSNSTVRGMFDVASGLPDDLPKAAGSAGYLAGYMTEVPEEWRSSFGGYTHLGGQGGSSIQKRSNAGPGAYLFNASEIGLQQGDVVPLSHYPLETTPSAPLHWDPRVNQNAPQIFTVNPDFNQTTRVRGVFFVPGTRSVLFLGLTAAVSTAPNSQARVYYGLNNEYAQTDPYSLHKGEHSLGGDYQYQIWAYDIEEFQRVFAGNLHPTEVKPYEVFRFNFPGVSSERGGRHQIGGTAINYDSGLLYITQQMQDSKESALVHVYDLR